MLYVPDIRLKLYSYHPPKIRKKVNNIYKHLTPTRHYDELVVLAGRLFNVKTKSLTAGHCWGHCLSLIVEELLDGV